MIRKTTGNLLNSDAEALVNAVNCVGVMGKGIALQFKQSFPTNYAAYAVACKRGEVEPGKMFVFHTNRVQNPRFIINFATKQHWRDKSRLKDIESGLKALIDVIEEEGIRSVAVPPLGCGNGGLDWGQVREEIERAFSDVPDVEAQLYEPQGAPNAEELKVSTARPQRTSGRAAI